MAHRSHLLLIALALLATDCAKLGYLGSALFHPPERSRVALAGGEERDVYSFDTGGGASDTYLYFVGGSGCPSLRYYLRRYLEGLRPGIRVLALQKAHVGTMATGSSCSRQFDADDTFPRWVADQTAFIQSTLGRAERAPRKVVMFGVSEGGDVAPAVAARLPTVTHVVVVANGALSTRKAMERRFGPRWPRAEAALRADPQSLEKRLLGQTFRYWSALLPYDPTPDFLALDRPILMAIGGRDEPGTTEAARLLQQRFAAAGKSNLRVVVYPNASHVLEDPDGTSHRPDVIRELNELLGR